MRYAEITACPVSLFLVLPALLFGLADGKTKFKTLDHLYRISGEGTVVGVHNKLSKTPSSFTDAATQITGKTPGLWGGDFLFDSESIEHRWTMIHEAKRQWEAGAMISIMWHACNPTLHEPCSWSNHCNGDGPWSGDVGDDKWNALITDGTPLNARWKEMMDDIAQYLQWLDLNGVEVLFRPLHEMNQNCFWWGGRGGANGTRRLYQIFHDYLTVEKKLTNLIWVWNIQDFDTLEYDVDAYNPGDEYWDIATLDIYEGYTKEKYEIMMNISNGKPLGIGECWVVPSPGRLEAEPSWAFFMSWSELTFKLPNTGVSLKTIYNATATITLDGMPGWERSLTIRNTTGVEFATSAPSPPPFVSESTQHLVPSSVWSVEYSQNHGITVDLGKEYNIDLVRLRWEDLSDLTSSSNVTSGSLARIHVDEKYDHISLNVSSGPGSSFWLELYHTHNENI